MTFLAANGEPLTEAQERSLFDAGYEICGHVTKHVEVKLCVVDAVMQIKVSYPDRELDVEFEILISTWQGVLHACLSLIITGQAPA